MAIYSSASNQTLNMTSTPEFNNVTNALVVVATAAGTTTLTASSANGVVFTGSTTQTLILPVVSTLSPGTSFRIINKSSGVVTVESSGGNTIQAMAQNTSLLVICISLSGTDATSWQPLYVPTAPFAFPLVPSLGGTGISNSDANTLTITGVSSINQNVTTTGTPTFTSTTIGNLNLAVNTISSTNINGAVGVVPNGTGAILLRATQAYVPASISPAAYASATQALLPYATIRLGSGAPSASYMGFSTASTTLGVFSAISAGDPICRIVGYADDGTSFVESGLEQWVAAGTISTGIVPCTWNLYTANASGVRTLGMAMSQAQILTLTNPLPAGSGGTGITSLGTGVATALGQNVTGSGGIVLANAPTFVTGTVTAPSVTFSSTSGIIGTTTNNSAAAGSVGEEVESIVVYPGSGITTNTAQNVTSISLTAGDWDIWGIVCYTGNTLTMVTNATGWTSTTSATQPADPTNFSSVSYGVAQVVYNSGYLSFPVPQKRYSLSGTTTIYLSGLSVFTTNVTNIFGAIYARRRR